jgi:hypothetical protein
MDENKVKIRSHKKSYILIFYIISLMTLFLLYQLIYQKLNDGERYFLIVFIVVSIILIIITMVQILSKKPRAILSSEGFWHKDSKDIILWNDISFYYFEETLNDNFNCIVIILGIKSKSKKVGYDLTLTGLSIEEFNKLINRFRGETQIVYKGVIKR